MGDVAELVADAAGGADGFVDVAVGVAINPIIYSAASNIVSQFHREGSIDSAAKELRGNQLVRRYMVCDHYLMLGFAGADGLLDKVYATLMFAVKIRISQ